ncbi:MAG: DNA polymerase III subunit beta [Pyrinomonadaceae bacterium]|nr:DNA polymerase III subunit beta [Pyrinomonadaceae bacterium]
MEFSIGKNVLQKELGFVQGIVEKKNTIPVLSNILIESVGEGAIRITGTDLDTTIRCETEAEIKAPGAMCVNARKLFDIARVLPEASVNFRKEDNNWVAVKCERSNFRIAGVERESFPELPDFRSASIKLPGSVFETLIKRTIFAITLEESRYTLSGAKFLLDKTGGRMVTTDGHRLAYIERKDLGANVTNGGIDTLIPRKTLAELTKLTASHEGEIGLATDENHIYFEMGPRLLVSRTLAGQFPNYEMVIPKNNDKSAMFDSGVLGQAIRRVALMADDRSHAIRFHLVPGNLHISSQTAEEGEARETVATEYAGDEMEIGFNAQYLQDFLNIASDGQISFEFRDGNSQAQLRPVSDTDYDYKYIIMPMRL